MGKEMKYVQKLVALHQRPVVLTKEQITDSAVRRLVFEAGQDIDDLIIFCGADSTSKFQWKLDKYARSLDLLKQKITEIEEKDRLRNWEPPITGGLIMQTFGLSPCKEVGQIKNSIREAILDGDIQNDYQEAFDFMLQKAAEIGLKPVSR